MDFLLDNEYTSFIILAIVYLGLAFVLFFLGRVIYQMFHSKIKVVHELVETDNVAFSLSYVGYYIGLIIVIGGAIVGPSAGLMNDVIDISVYGLLGIVLLNISTLINDKVILRKFSVHKELIEDHNPGTGVIEMANSIGSGLIIYGAVVGDSSGMLSGITSAVVFWLLGQLIFILITRLYNAITPYDIHDEIEKDNFAAGIGFAGALVAIANLLRFALSIEFESWASSFLDVGIQVVVGVVFIPVTRLLVDKLLLPNYDLTHEIVHQEKPNVGAALVEAFAYVGGSVLITWCL
jgi:uncharacterized membrane protein YjfL (UPF0719 family)